MENFICVHEHCSCILFICSCWRKGLLCSWMNCSLKCSCTHEQNSEKSSWAICVHLFIEMICSWTRSWTLNSFMNMLMNTIFVHEQCSWTNMMSICSLEIIVHERVHMFINMSICSWTYIMTIHIVHEHVHEHVHLFMNTYDVHESNERVHERIWIN